ncbi:hypothetical protein WMY93_022300 [Mugilogobius chulae]|uniref:Uncharacterized protein n=1 Tax=Mugilogobius chulae TaxID=88201 RepID=A0AAW0N9L0_9GOBI
MAVVWTCTCRGHDLHVLKTRLCRTNTDLSYQCGQNSVDRNCEQDQWTGPVWTDQCGQNQWDRTSVDRTSVDGPVGQTSVDIPVGHHQCEQDQCGQDQ